MSKKLNVTAVKKSAKCIKDAHAFIREHFNSINHGEIARGFFDSQGYSYTIESETGDFAISPVSGAYIRGKWNGEMYEVSVELNYSGLSAASVDMYPPVLISPFALNSYKPFFDKLIADIKSEYRGFDTLVKGEMGVKLIKPLIKPILREKRITKSTVEICDGETENFWLSKRIFGNAYLRVKINYHNLEESCNLLAESLKSVPKWLRDNEEVIVSRTKKLKGDEIRGTNSEKNTPEFKQMYYDEPLQIDSLSKDEYSTSKLSQTLDRLGFVYNVDSSGEYKIYLNKRTFITWDGSYYPEEIDETEFIKMLEMITLGASSDTNYRRRKYEMRIITPTVHKILSDEAVFIVGEEFYCYYKFSYSFKFKGVYYSARLSMDKPISTLWELIKTINSGIDLLGSFESLGAEIVINEKYCEKYWWCITT